MAHCPGFGVKVYVEGPGVDVFIVAGLHVPCILLSEVPGSGGGVLPWHNDAIGLKVGSTASLITTVMV